MRPPTVFLALGLAASVLGVAADLQNQNHPDEHDFADAEHDTVDWKCDHGKECEPYHKSRPSAVSGSKLSVGNGAPPHLSHQLEERATGTITINPAITLEAEITSGFVTTTTVGLGAITEVISVVSTSPPAVIVHIDNNSAGPGTVDVVWPSGLDGPVVESWNIKGYQSTTTIMPGTTVINKRDEVTSTVSDFAAIATSTVSKAAAVTETVTGSAATDDAVTTKTLISSIVPNSAVSITTVITSIATDAAAVTETVTSLSTSGSADATETLTVSGSVPSNVASDTATVSVTSSSSVQQATTTTSSASRSAVTVTFEDDGTSTVTTYPTTSTSMVVSSSSPTSTLATPTVSSAVTVTLTTTEAFPTSASNLASAPTIVQTIVSTVTMMDFGRCTKKPQPFAQTASVADIFGTTVVITAATQTFHNNTVIVAPPPSPEATLFPVNDYPESALDVLHLATNSSLEDGFHRKVLDMSSDEVRDYFPFTDWATAAQLAHTLRRSQSRMDWDLAWKLAVLHLQPKSVAHQSKREATLTNADINGVTVPITRATQTLGPSTVIVANAAPYDYHSAARQSPIPSPPACHKGAQHNKTKCNEQKCMLKHYKPINITTIFPAELLRDSDPDRAAYGYFTQSTSLTRVHYGTTDSWGAYYPTKPTISPSNGTPMPTVVRDIPQWVTHRRIRDLHDDPKCFDHLSCCEQCAKEAKHPHSWFDPGGWKFWSLLASALAALTSALCCLGCCLRCLRNHSRNRKIDPNAPLLAAVPILGHRHRRQKVVDPATGQTVTEVVQTSGGGNGINPLVAAAGGAAAANALDRPGATGTTTGAETVVDDGRGTMSRRAEEGRGKVQFAEGTAPGAIESIPGGATTSTTDGGRGGTSAPVVVEQVVTSPSGQVISAPGQNVTTLENVTPVPVHDGALDAHPTGRQMVDMGSMRGRKRSRLEGAPAHGNLLNIPF